MNGATVYLVHAHDIVNRPMIDYDPCIIQFLDDFFIFRITSAADMESCFRIFHSDCSCSIKKLLNTLLLEYLLSDNSMSGNVLSLLLSRESMHMIL